MAWHKSVQMWAKNFRG